MNHKDFYFVSPEHRQRFLAAMQQTGKIYGDHINEEYGAALYILTSSSGTWERAKGYVSSRGIQFDELLAQGYWSGGYMGLLQLAGNLFNAGYTQCSPVDLPTRLDDRNFQVAMTALLIRRKSWHLGNFMADDEIVQKVDDILGTQEDE